MVDAVCCVYFCAAGKSSLLIKILVELGMEFLIPAEVEREVLSKHRGQTTDQWRRLRSSPRVRILAELTPADDRADVVAAVVLVRRMSVPIAALSLNIVPPDKLRKSYEELTPFGSGLPTWNASTIKHKHAEWRRTRQTPTDHQTPGTV